MYIDLVKIFFPAVVAFAIGIAITPRVSKWLYDNRMWKKTAREHNNPDAMSQAYVAIHNTEAEKKTPRIGGVIVWGSVLLTVLMFWVLGHVLNSEFASQFNFFSREQTWLVLAGLLGGSLIGLWDELLQIGVLPRFGAHGISGWKFAGIVAMVSVVFSLWFYVKLGVASVMVPFVGSVFIGWLFVPFFIVVMLGIFSSGVIDGVDGLAGGVLATVFGAYAIIALTQNQIDIAALSLVITASILAFLWFNIMPARFYMGETGMLGLSFALTLIVFLTGQVLPFLIIGFPLVATSASSFIQIVSKKYFGRKVFRVAPLHHHFEALGWSRAKIVMRYWVFSVMCAMAGVVLVLASNATIAIG